MKTRINNTQDYAYKKKIKQDNKAMILALLVIFGIMLLTAIFG